MVVTANCLSPECFLCVQMKASCVGLGVGG